MLHTASCRKKLISISFADPVPFGNCCKVTVFTPDLDWRGTLITPTFCLFFILKCLVVCFSVFSQWWRGFFTLIEHCESAL